MGNMKSVPPLSYEEFLRISDSRGDAPVYRQAFRGLAFHNYIYVEGELPLEPESPMGLKSKEREVEARFAKLEKRISTLEKQK